MACLIRQMKVDENRFINYYIDNGKTHESDFLEITSTTDDTTQLRIKISYDQMVTFEVSKNNCIEQQYDQDICLTESVSKLFLITVEVHLEIWHMSQISLDILSQFNSSSTRRIAG